MSKMSSLPATHPVLGPLHYDSKRNLYEGQVRVGEREIALRLKPDKGGDFAGAEMSAVRFATSAESEIQAISEFLADRYLERLNGEWRLPGQKTVSYARFVAVVQPDTATFYGNGTGEFICGGNRLFEGHCLIARTRPNGVVFDSELSG